MKYAWIVLVLVLGAGISLYAAYGQAEPDNTDAQMMTTSQEKTASVTQLLAGLETRLAQSPDDGKGWLLLAKSYEHLGRLGNAASAYEKANALGVTDEQFLFRLMSKSSGWDTRK